MSRQHTRYNSRAYVFPEDFPQRLKRFQEESGLSWSEIARRLGTYRHTVWRWAEGRAQPNHQHRKALMELADSLMRYTIPMPDDSPIPGRNAEEMALNGSVLSTVKNSGPLIETGVRRQGFWRRGRVYRSKTQLALEMLQATLATSSLCLTSPKTTLNNSQRQPTPRIDGSVNTPRRCARAPHVRY